MKTSSATQKNNDNRSKQVSHYDALENKVSEAAAESFHRPAYQTIGPAEYIKRKRGAVYEPGTGN